MVTELNRSRKGSLFLCCDFSFSTVLNKMQSRLLSFLLLKPCSFDLGRGRTGLSECIFYVLLAAPLLTAPESKETAAVIKERERKNSEHSCVRGILLPAACCSLWEEHKSYPPCKQLKVLYNSLIVIILRLFAVFDLGARQ